MSSRDDILNDIRVGLHREAGAPVPPRPSIVPPRTSGDRQSEIQKFITEVIALKGSACQLGPAEVPNALGDLVRIESIKKATVWNTERLGRLGVMDKLKALGVEIIPHDADKGAMAEADLGITEADFMLPETGTLALLSSPDKPRSVSLLPRVHLAIVHPRTLRNDLHDVFAEAKHEGYMIFITGPSRTSDIELITTIGVHGPKTLYVWIVND